MADTHPLPGFRIVLTGARARDPTGWQLNGQSTPKPKPPEPSTREVGEEQVPHPSLPQENCSDKETVTRRPKPKPLHLYSP